MLCLAQFGEPVEKMGVERWGILYIGQVEPDNESCEIPKS